MIHSDRMHLDAFVGRLSAHSVLSEAERQAILALPGDPSRVDKRRDFLRRNGRSSDAYLILSGMVGRFSETREGARQIIAFHLPGEMVDLQSTVRPVALGGLTALTDTTILRVSHDALRDVAGRFPRIAEAFWRDCMLDDAILMEWLVNVGRRNAQTRLAHLLCEMSIRAGADRNVLFKYAFPITQEQLGDAVALTSVHTNRSLRGLTDLVTMKGGYVTIHDWEALAHLAEFDPGYLIAVAGETRQKLRHTDAGASNLGVFDIGVEARVGLNTADHSTHPHVSPLTTIRTVSGPTPI